MKEMEPLFLPFNVHSVTKLDKSELPPVVISTPEEEKAKEKGKHACLHTYAYIYIHVHAYIYTRSYSYMLIHTNAHTYSYIIVRTQTQKKRNKGKIIAIVKIDPWLVIEATPGRGKVLLPVRVKSQGRIIGRIEELLVGSLLNTNTSSTGTRTIGRSVMSVCSVSVSVYMSMYIST